MNDDDIRTVLVKAHEPAPTFEAIRERTPRRSLRAGFAVVGAAATIAVFVFAWPPGKHVERAPLDLASPALSSTKLALPLDSLLDVPGLAVLETTPKLVTGGQL